MTSQEDNDAPEQLSTRDKWRQAADTAGSLFVCLGSSIGIAYFLVYREPRFDRIHTKFGVPPEVSEIAGWGVAVMLYLFAIVGAWMLKSEIEFHRLGHKCAFFVAVLLTAPVGLVAVFFLWNILGSLPVEAWLIMGFLIWQRLVVEANYRKFNIIVTILAEIQQSVRNIEKEKN